jgi:hypothetical protein
LRWAGTLSQGQSRKKSATEKCVVAAGRGAGNPGTGRPVRTMSKLPGAVSLEILEFHHREQGSATYREREISLTQSPERAGYFTIPEPSHDTSTNKETKSSNSPACAFGFGTAGACCFFSSFSFFPTQESLD